MSLPLRQQNANAKDQRLRLLRLLPSSSVVPKVWSLGTKSFSDNFRMNTNRVVALFWVDTVLIVQSQWCARLLTTEMNTGSGPCVVSHCILCLLTCMGIINSSG